MEAKRRRKMVKFKVQFAKQGFEYDLPEDTTVGTLKEDLEKKTGIPSAIQKLMKGGMLKDDTATLSKAGIGEGAKLMLIGSKVEDVLAVNINISADETPAASTSQASSSSGRVSLSQEESHKKVIAKGPPEDAEPGDKTKKLPLPRALKGILTKNGKVRLTFKSDVDQLWIASATSTQQLQYNSIRAIHSEPIEGHENYHIMSLQLGSSETQKYWLYFVPAQYVDAIKNEILGFGYF